MYIYGDQTMSVPEHLSFSKFMLDKLRNVKGDVICFENGQTRERLTYREVTQYAVNLSAALSKLGVRRGDVVAIGADPFLHYIPTVLAVMFTGATWTAYLENIGTAVLNYRLELAKPKYLICSATFWSKYEDLMISFDCIKTFIAVEGVSNLEISLSSLISMNENVDVESFEPALVQVQTDTVLITYSTGTTNMPKGIKRSHLNELSSVILRGFEKLTSLTSVLIIRPWSLHFNTSVTLKFMSLGKKVVYAYDLPIKTTLEILRDCEVDAIFVTPNYIREMAYNSQPTDDYFDNLKLINCSGNSLTAEMFTALQKSFPKVKITQSYGSTECEDTMRNDNDSKPESMGRVRPGAIVKVVDQKTRAVLGPNRVGEICVRGPTVTQGYINIDIGYPRCTITYKFKTQKCPIVKLQVYHDGFFMTGDLGYYDEDQYFFFVDRIANFIRFKNDKVSPGELENVLLQHPAVLDVGVVGRPAPDVHEVPVAFVVKKPGTEVTEEELIAFVASQVSPYMQLRGGVIFISEVPKSEGDKPLRRELKNLLNKYASS